MKLDDNLWKTLQGSYKMNYDVSLPLKQLEETENKQETEKIFEGLSHLVRDLEAV